MAIKQNAIGKVADREGNLLVSTNRDAAGNLIGLWRA
jgi:hypothetical protein